MDAEAKEILKFEFGTKYFNLFEPHGICKNHCAKVHYPWIHGTFHWHKKGPWRYYYNDSKPNEPVSIATTLKIALQEAIA